MVCNGDSVSSTILVEEDELELTIFASPLLSISAGASSPPAVTVGANPSSPATPLVSSPS